jgi:hypothetical protein
MVPPRDNSPIAGTDRSSNPFVSKKGLELSAGFLYALGVYEPQRPHS